MTLRKLHVKESADGANENAVAADRDYIFAVAGPPRTAVSAAQLAGYPAGTVAMMDGVLYTVDPTATGTASATNDLSVAGLTYYDPLASAPFFYTAVPDDDGLGASIIPDRNCFVLVPAVTNDADDWIVLPTATVGRTIRGYSTVAHEIRTTASSNVKINNVDADGGAAEAAIPALTLWQATCVAATLWVLTAVDNVGAVVTAIQPD